MTTITFILNITTWFSFVLLGILTFAFGLSFVIFLIWLWDTIDEWQSVRNYRKKERIDKELAR